MAIVQVCALFDRAANAFGQPMFVVHTNMAIRAFNEALNSPQSDVSKNTMDFKLMHVGEFDDQTGKFMIPPEPVLLIDGLDVVRRENAARAAAAVDASKQMNLEGVDNG